MPRSRGFVDNFLVAGSPSGFTAAIALREALDVCFLSSLMSYEKTNCTALDGLSLAEAVEEESCKAIFNRLAVLRTLSLILLVEQPSDEGDFIIISMALDAQSEDP